MKKVNIASTFELYDSVQELPDEVQNLMGKAIEARKNAYAPYSKFQVGAAILLSNGKIVIGNNQENASYPSGLCAERVAIYQAGAQYPNTAIHMLAISATSLNTIVKEPIPPCGACRQTIAEYEFKQENPIAIYFMGAEGKVMRASSLASLLPLAFDKEFLK